MAVIYLASCFIADRKSSLLDSSLLFLFIKISRSLGKQSSMTYDYQRKLSCSLHSSLFDALKLSSSPALQLSSSPALQQIQTTPDGQDFLFVSEASKIRKLEGCYTFLCREAVGTCRKLSHLEGHC
jgi:hypothetical protein